MRLIPILIADDDPKVCSALRLRLEEQPNLRVVGEALDWQDLLIQLQGKAGQDGQTLLLLDWELPGFKPAGYMPVLRSVCPGLKVIALSARIDARQAALLSGADTFISKSDSPGQVMAALELLLDNGSLGSAEEDALHTGTPKEPI